jgi:hypothetical protein
VNTRSGLRIGIVSDRCLSVHDSRLENERNMFEKQIDILDKKIDHLVYELYGLSEDEIKIVEQK